MQSGGEPQEVLKFRSMSDNSTDLKHYGKGFCNKLITNDMSIA